jgi:carbon starvation protein
VLIVIVIADAARIWIRAVRARRPLPTTETPFVQSRIVAPAGLLPTAEDRAAMAGAGAGEFGGRFERARVGDRTGAGGPG